MARTKSTRRLLPREVYEANARSAAQVAARVPPSRSQFHDAFDYIDELTVLDYLRLAPTMPRDMDETNAFVVRHGRLPPPSEMPSAASEGTSEYPYAWCWPFGGSPLIRPATVFEFAVQYAFADVLEWLFCARERVACLGATLVLELPDMLRAAARGRHLHIVEMLLTSPVFVELLSTARQQAVLDNVLHQATTSAMRRVLLAHGADVEAVVTRYSLSAAPRRQLRVQSPTAQLLRSVVGRRDRAALERSLREAVVVDASVLVVAMELMDPVAVETVLSRGFVDVDARVEAGRTPLMTSASQNDQYDDKERRACRRQIVRYLVVYGADTTLRNERGETVLHMAAANSNLACLEALLDHSVATSGAEAVHNDVSALALAFEARDAYGDHSQRVLKALLVRGACSRAYEEMVRTGRVVSDACGNPRHCLRQMKRKRDAQESEDDSSIGSYES